MSNYVQAIFTVLSLVNPAICAAIFSKLVTGKPRATQISQATKAILAVFVILALAAIAGAQLLNVFGISLSAFRVAGGLVLVWMGFLMLRGNSGPTSSPESTEQNTPSGDSSAITPLILFAASPGTITGVITLSVSHSGHSLPVTALAAVTVSMILTWIMLLVSTQKSSDNKSGLFHDVSTRFMGLIVLAMGVQFLLTGLKEFFHST